MKNIFTILFVLALFGAANAQGLAYGFKAGLNFSTLEGDLEKDDKGASVEEFNRVGSFHVGFGFSYGFTERIGARAELMYSQKGARFRYEGTSYEILTSKTGDLIYSNGTRNTINNVLNSYIDLPVLFYARPLSWLEISFGPSVGLLVSSTGSGSTAFSGKTFLIGGTPSEKTVPEHSFTLETNYLSDETGEADVSTTTPLTIGSQTVDIPANIGAYYDIPRGDGSFFNALDLGLNAGLSLYLSPTLYIGGRLNYGLSDVTNNNYEFSQVKLDAQNARIPRADMDRNVSIQASVGFNLR
ncbi:MAG: PorT family protein [Saprospirales bacterium]|nr:PorT family protein [Saprospirales bacterium]MBK6903573.1 PorT family protein [Saprospirales bacterium]MBK7338654.1 PorT family protein [Saprospirales bacterium]